MQRTVVSPQPKDQRAAMMRDLGRALTHSLELVIALGIGVWLGLQAQKAWPGIAPWGLIGGFLLGAGAVLRSMWRIMQEGASVPPGQRESREGNHE